MLYSNFGVVYYVKWEYEKLFGYELKVFLIFKEVGDKV